MIIQLCLIVFELESAIGDDPDVHVTQSRLPILMAVKLNTKSFWNRISTLLDKWNVSCRLEA
jgi:hypothetical protein